MQFTIDEYVDAIKYHNHQYNKTNLEMLEDIKADIEDHENEEINELEKEIEEKDDIIYDQDQTISKLEDTITELETKLEDIEEAINSGEISLIKE